MGYKSETQQKNLAWFLPRPKPDHYKGGMPLHCEKWLLELAGDILKKDFEKCEILNAFAGMNKYGTRVDLNMEVKPDLAIDMHEAAKYFKNNCFDIILADPPYSNEEAKQLYDTPKLNYKKWTQECTKILRPGGLLIVYHKYIML